MAGDIVRELSCRRPILFIGTDNSAVNSWKGFVGDAGGNQLREIVAQPGMKTVQVKGVNLMKGAVK